MNNLIELAQASGCVIPEGHEGYYLWIIQAWMRNEKKKSVVLYCDFAEYNYDKTPVCPIADRWCYEIDGFDDCTATDSDYIYPSYEAALEAGLLATLLEKNGQNLPIRPPNE